MKIEELYTKNDSVSEKKVLLEAKANSCSIKDKLSHEVEHKKFCKGCKTSGNSAEYKTPKRKGRASANKSRRSRSKMKLEQVNRHEEYSFLLEAETNQAILENIVCKDELCRYLTPLKFIEIDTWRRDVPYGLNQDRDDERRKWRTPLEILYGGILQKEKDLEQPEKSSKKTKRQTVQSAIHLKEKRKNMTTNVEDNDTNGKSAADPSSKKTDVTVTNEQDDDVKNESNAYKTRDAWQRRPATSPERKIILNKVRNEKILSRHQPSTAAFLAQKGNARSSFQNGRLYGLREGLIASSGFYPRSPVSSANSLKRTISASSGLKIRSLSQDNYENHAMNSIFKTQKLEYGQQQQHNGNHYLANFSSCADQINSNKATFPFARPRTRGRGKPQEAKIYRRQTDENVAHTAANPHPPEQSKEEVAKRLSNHHADPNIAYVPHSARNSNSERNNVHTRLPQQTAAAKNNNPVPISSIVTNTQQNSNESPTVIEETICLPRGSMFSSNHTSPRADDVTPRIVHSGELLTNRSWTSKLTSSSYQSPWVAQALPDFSNKEVAARARKEGYYVRKPSRTVSFQMPETDYDRRPLRPYNRNDEAPSKKNISMVVVNVDEPSQTARDMLTRTGAIKLTQKTNSFSGRNAISVKQ